jgi:hypothetical protein
LLASALLEAEREDRKERTSSRPRRFAVFEAGLAGELGVVRTAELGGVATLDAAAVFEEGVGPSTGGKGLMKEMRRKGRETNAMKSSIQTALRAESEASVPRYRSVQQRRAYGGSATNELSGLFLSASSTFANEYSSQLENLPHSSLTFSRLVTLILEATK